MTSDVHDDVVKRTYALYSSTAYARLLLDSTAQRERDASYTSITRIAKIIGADRTAAIALAKQLEDAGCGRYIVGRRGSISRFEWEFSCISLGRAMTGKAVELKKVDKYTAEGDQDPGESDPVEGGAFTIAKAKEELSKSLGVPIENIEILIRG